MCTVYPASKAKLTEYPSDAQGLKTNLNLNILIKLKTDFLFEEMNQLAGDFT